MSHPAENLVVSLTNLYGSPSCAKINSVVWAVLWWQATNTLWNEASKSVGNFTANVLTATVVDCEGATHLITFVDSFGQAVINGFAFSKPHKNYTVRKGTRGSARVFFNFSVSEWKKSEEYKTQLAANNAAKRTHTLDVIAAYDRLAREELAKTIPHINDLLVLNDTIKEMDAAAAVEVTTAIASA